MAKELLKARANMHAVNKSGKSVIDYAKESQSEEMINLINHVIKKDHERVKRLKEKNLVTAWLYF